MCTRQVAVYLPSTVVAVIIEIPGSSPVMIPFAFTLAMVVSLENHVTAVLVASAGLIVTLIESCDPAFIKIEGSAKIIPVVETKGVSFSHEFNSNKMKAK